VQEQLVKFKQKYYIMKYEVVWNHSGREAVQEGYEEEIFPCLL